MKNQNNYLILRRTINNKMNNERKQCHHDSKTTIALYFLLIL